MSKIDAVHHAAITRLRPILMTTVATVVGHFPLTLVTGPGAEARNSIGVVLVGGMTIGTHLHPLRRPLRLRPHRPGPPRKARPRPGPSRSAPHRRRLPRPRPRPRRVAPPPHLRDAPSLVGPLPASPSPAEPRRGSLCRFKTRRISPSLVGPLLSFAGPRRATPSHSEPRRGSLPIQDSPSLVGPAPSLAEALCRFKTRRATPSHSGLSADSSEPFALA